MKQSIQYTIIISSVLLIITILMQNQGSSLGSGFGGESSFYRSKRGFERILYYATIVLAIIFVGSILAGLIVQ